MEVGRLRAALGIACVSVALFTLVLCGLRAVHALESSIDLYTPLDSASERLLLTGDALGVPRSLQVAALADIPPTADYALDLPLPESIANSEGITPVAYGMAGSWFLYLLLPAEPATLRDARYIICWYCDASTLGRHLVWIWRGTHNLGIGRVSG